MGLTRITRSSTSTTRMKRPLNDDDDDDEEVQFVSRKRVKSRGKTLKSLSNALNDNMDSTGAAKPTGAPKKVKISSHQKKANTAAELKDSSEVVESTFSKSKKMNSKKVKAVFEDDDPQTVDNLPTGSKASGKKAKKDEEKRLKR